ncbi:MAG: hypothetical protein QRY72_02135 [Candidatus Rhabdochlamydia sp.]
MSRTIENFSYTQALHTLESKLQTSSENVEAKKVIHYLATLQAVDPLNPFQAFESNSQNVFIKSFVEEVNQLATNIFACIKQSADGADLSSQTVCSDLRDISQTILFRKYQTAFDRFKNQIINLKNPYLKREILTKIEECLALSKKDRSSLSFLPLLSISLPEEMKQCIQKFEEEYEYFLTIEGSEKEHFPSQVQDAFKQIYQSEYQELILDWNAYNLFFNFVWVKQLKNEVTEKIQALIYAGNIDTFKREMEGIFKENNIDKNGFEKEIKQTKYNNIATLLAQIIKQKPISKEGVFTYWGKPSGFFLSKTLYLTDPESLETHNGTILKAGKTSTEGWLFELHDGSHVRVEKTGITTIIQKHRYKFWMALINHTLKKGDVITLEQASDRQMGEWICPGEYQISQIQEYQASFKKDAYLEVTLTDTVSQAPMYSLRSYFHVQNGIKHDHGILIYSNQEGKFSSLFKKAVPTSYFNATHTAILTEIRRAQGIKQANLDDQIMIKDERDENKIKLAYLEQIKKNQDVIRSELLKPEGTEILNRLLDQLVWHEMQAIGEEGMQDFAHQRPDLHDLLQEISQQYNDHLHFQRSPEKILKKVVKEANYAFLVDKSQSVFVSRTMKLLKDSDKHLEKIKGQDVVFFLGNTGAGKSAAISYFLGAEMELFINHVGDEVIRIKEDSQSEEQGGYPTIGQSLGESETLYAKGYAFKDRNYVLGDCPGFNDTRGGDFELCTNLSIDRAIDQSKAVRSIVITVPVHAFLVDRANALIELIETVREKFTGAFEPSQIALNSNFFLLITKQNQVSEEVIKNIRNGNRIQELLNESKKKLEVLIQEWKTGGHIDDFELKSIERREGIWQTLRLMHDRGQIDFLDIEDTFERDELLHKYTTAASKEVNKQRYIKAMQSQDMQMKMGKYIEMSVHTWSHAILKPYLHEIPETISKFQKELQIKTAKIAQIEEAKKERERRINQFIALEKELTLLIDQLEAAKENASSLTDLMLQEELESKLQLVNDQNALQAEEKYEASAQSLFQKQEELKRLQKEIEKSESIISQKQGVIQQLQNEITSLSQGSITQTLWEASYTWNKTFEVFSYKSEQARQNAFNEIRHALTEEMSDDRVINTSTYKGSLCEIALIEKEYRLVPKDASMQADFMKVLTPAQNRNSFTAVGGKFTAVVEGSCFNVDLGRKVAPDGKKMIYSFQTHWDGITLPWIKITHTIPNTDFNEAAIINKESEITALNRIIQEQERTLNNGSLHPTRLFLGAYSGGKKTQKNQLALQISILEQEKNQLGQEKARAKGVITHSIEEIQKAKKEELSYKIQEREREENSQELEQEMDQAQQEFRGIEKSIHMKQKEKRNFAIIVKSQGETAKLLRKFSEFVFNQQMLITRKESLVIACEEFQKLYDQNIQRLETEWRQDLNLSSIK